MRKRTVALSLLVLVLGFVLAGGAAWLTGAQGEAWAQNPKDQIQSSGPSESSGSNDMAGDWLDVTDKVVVTILATPSGFHIDHIVDSMDGEVFQLQSESFSGDRMVMSYLVPSTGYIVNFDCHNMGTTMACQWSNNHGMSGQETLARMYD